MQTRCTEKNSTKIETYFQPDAEHMKKHNGTIRATRAGTPGEMTKTIAQAAD